MYFFKGNTRSGFNSFFFLKKGSHHSPYLFFLHWVLKCSFQKIQHVPLASAIALLLMASKTNEIENLKCNALLFTSSTHFDQRFDSLLYLQDLHRVCLRVAARFMQCGKDYPPLCLHALFCLHTHDVLTNLVNCIFCRRPQKWWAARKELVASEQVKKSHGFWTLKVGFTRVLHIYKQTPIFFIHGH